MPKSLKRKSQKSNKDNNNSEETNDLVIKKFKNDENNEQKSQIIENPENIESKEGNSNDNSEGMNGTEEDNKSKVKSSEKRAPNGKNYDLKIVSWNVNGIRANIKKNGVNDIKKQNADIICLQETKCSEEDMPSEMKDLTEYRFKYFSDGEKDGYSGVCILSKTKPIRVNHGIGVKEHDSEGRVITAEFEKFYLVTAYVPNSGRGLPRLDYRMQWDRDFAQYLKNLDDIKPVILCGDLNVAHKEIDLENPKTNTKTAGFTKEERENFTQLLAKGFIDSFRHLYPDSKKSYTFWSYMRNARQKDIGWRLDYFLISQRILNNLVDNRIESKIMGSDHCPIVLFMAFE
jgi:AP endonuclease-1